MKTHLNVVVLHTPDLDAARRFYTQTLGLNVAAEHPGMVLEFESAGGAELALMERPRTGSGTPQEVWFTVPDADAYHAQVGAAGANVTQAPHDGPFGRAFSVQTPDGHSLTFHESASG